ncbi:hypothetical protein ABN028_30415 [Actinopolymorpha sp. B17G11]|uniref:hypothetical protein n=1 Tax=Actinopolymorpha sp. B17G11 TaxID=3160861 RepID=UPI0032E3F41E
MPATLWCWLTSCAPTLPSTAGTTDSELAQAVRVLARAQQDAVWDPTAVVLRLRSLLREYHPAMLKVAASLEDGLAAPVARMLLETAPDPEKAARPTVARLTRLLVKAGRSRRLSASAERLHLIFGAEYMRQPAQVERAFARQVLALLAMLNAAIANCEELAEATIEAFHQHPGAKLPPVRPRRPPRSRPTQPVQPNVRHGSPLPRHRPALRRAPSPSPPSPNLRSAGALSPHMTTRSTGCGVRLANS